MKFQNLFGKIFKISQMLDHCKNCAKSKDENKKETLSTWIKAK